MTEVFTVDDGAFTVAEGAFAVDDGVSQLQVPGITRGFWPLTLKLI